MAMVAVDGRTDVSLVLANLWLDSFIFSFAGG